MTAQENATVQQRNLGLEAMEARIHALSEYLSVYRASYASGPTRLCAGRIRELRRDIWRLRGWAWYLAASQQPPLWLRALLLIARSLAGVVPRPASPGARRNADGRIEHLPAMSLLERAYDALEDDIQGRLLTLQLAQRQRPNNRRDQTIARLQEKSQQLQLAKHQLLGQAGLIPVICAVLGVVQRMASWVGLTLPQTDMVDP